MSQSTSIDVGEILDHGRWTAFQKITVLVCALTIILDGFDNQLIGLSIPRIMKDWGVAREAFTPVVTAGLVGMGVGTFFIGMIGDRFGRRIATILSVLIFGLATCAVSYAYDLNSFAILRFIAGFGIGGCLPNATTMVAEYTPLRRRTLAVTTAIVCVPLGGMIAGVCAEWILRVYDDWRPLYLFGGAAPLVFSIILLLRLPESPRFLVRKPKQWAKLAKLLTAMKQPPPPDAIFTDAREQQQQAGSKGGIAALFGKRTVTTLLISTAFFLGLMAVYTAFSWLPTMLTAEGLDAAVAAQGLTWYNLGGVFGAWICAIVISGLGSRWPLVICGIGAAGSAFALQSVPVTQTELFMAGLVVHGFFVNAIQSTMYAVCAYVYPTEIRATGTSFGLTIGRAGAILSALIGAQIISAGGVNAYLAMLWVAETGVTIALFLLPQHIPPRIGKQSAS